MTETSQTLTSLSPAQCATAPETCGLRMTAFVAEDPVCGNHTILMAKKETSQ